MQRTIVRIIRESILGIGVVGHFENRAAALYYLAQAAAAVDTQLETVAVDSVYAIASVNYVLEEVDCLSIEDVGRLRRLHEPLSCFLQQLTAAGEHDLEIRLPQDTSYGSLDSWS